jgi:hypothetical protein
MGWQKSRAYIGIKLQKLWPYTVMCSLLPPDCEARIQYYRFQESVFNVLLEPELIFYSARAWFILSGYS